jgi:adenine-specific DNA-methyltransferase
MSLHLNYIGSKKSLFHVLNKVFRRYVTSDTTFVDLFAGTGTVGRMVHHEYACRIFANDLQYYAYVVNCAVLNRYSLADIRLIQQKLVEYNTLRPINGYMCQNYAPPKRMYFTRANAGRIDAMRSQLEKDKPLLPERVYLYLLATIIVSADKVANTSSVYASYLKEFKSTAMKPITLPDFIPNNVTKSNNVVFNADALDVASKIRADVVYLDPPYNTRQYSTYYHILETIALYDKPKIHGVTGMRDQVQRSDFSSQTEVEEAFANLFKSLQNCRVIIMSYNDEGIVSMERLKELMKVHGKVRVLKIPYKKFKAQQGVERDTLFEYLFVCEKNIGKK